MDKKEVAVILLAGRERHLHRALSALKLQKERSFRVYVCDDASPEDIAPAVAEYEDALDIRYTRFDTHLGILGQSAHLERCLALTQDEPLVMFFSDEDELTPDAIRRVVRAARRHPEIAVFHLNTQWIDERSVVTGKARRFGHKMSADRLFRRIFTGGAPASLSSFVFRRGALERAIFQIRDVLRSPLTLVFSAMGLEGRLLTVCRARLLQRAQSSADESDPAETLGKADQLQSFFSWSEYFFGDNYPLKPRARVELFAAHAAEMYPARSEAEILDKFLRFRVFEREIGKGKGKRILHRSLSR